MLKNFVSNDSGNSKLGQKEDYAFMPLSTAENPLSNKYFVASSSSWDPGTSTKYNNTCVCVYFVNCCSRCHVYGL